MKKLRLVGMLGAIVAVLLITSGTSSAQYSGPKDFHGIVKIPIPFPSSYPPLNSGMPYNVMLGYIYYDSLVRYFNVHHNLRTDSLGMTIGPDTIRKALKYAYEMTDYDPIAWFQYQEELGSRTPRFMYTPPSELFDVLIHRASQVDSDKAVSAGLTNVDAILQVSVFDTSSVVDTTKPVNMNTVEGVQAWVDDVIKGQNLIGCNDTMMRAGQKGATALSTPPCIAFQYWLHWLRSIQETFGVWNNHRPPWATPGNDYIIFLKFIPLGQDSVSSYATLSPGGIYSTMACMYPIRSGVVYDPNNDFGLGTNLSVADFKSRLRAKIQSITSY